MLASTKIGSEKRYLKVNKVNIESNGDCIKNVRPEHKPIFNIGTDFRRQAFAF
jgi:hypothetical protein